MTISGTGILWIVNRFLASLVRLDSFDVSSRRIRPRSICSRDCPSIISQIDSNEYPDCQTPRFSADPFDFTPRYIYIYTFAPSNELTREKRKKKNSSSSSISFSRMENLNDDMYFSNLKFPPTNTLFGSGRASIRRDRRGKSVDAFERRVPNSIQE